VGEIANDFSGRQCRTVKTPGSYRTKYSYDAAGNRQGKVVDSVTAQTLTYTSASNRLATHNSQSVTLDAAGNTTADDGQGLGFWYDDHNRLTEAYVSSTLQATYAYNGQGQRVKKVEATGAERTIVYHYGLAGELIGETIYDDGGARIGERDYVWLDDLPVAQSEREFSGSTITSDTFVYLHADQLNTPRLATDSGGDVVWRWDSDAFGVGDADLDPDSDTNEVNVRLRFPGQYFDEETGLHYNYFRDYDPVIGRYVESDPIGLGDGVNTFAYVYGNPVIFVDETGEFGPLGFAIGVVFDFTLQMATNGWQLKCVDWGDVAIAGAVGLVSPGWMGSGARAFRQFDRAHRIQSRLETARRLRYIRRLTYKRNEALRNVGAELATQGAFQAVQETAQYIVQTRDECSDECAK